MEDKFNRHDNPDKILTCSCPIKIAAPFSRDQTKVIDTNLTLMGDNIAKGDEPQERRDSLESNIVKSNNNTTNTNGPGGYYDAEKCRAHIANQIRVSKIDRFSTQVSKALEVEASMKLRLNNILNMFIKCSAQAAHDFTLKCKLGLQRHRQDRILNHQRKPSKRGKVAPINHRYPDRQKQLNSTMSNDLLYGSGVQLVRKLMIQSNTFSKHIKRKPTDREEERYSQDCHVQEDQNQMGLIDEDYVLSDSFEPSTFVRHLEVLIKNNLRRSSAISMQLNTLRQLFERLASEHRDKVDIVYAAEEERQAATVVRRSAYNLSVAAFKATSTPVHVNTTNDTN